MLRPIQIIVACLLALTLTACRHVETIHYVSQAEHTLLIYMAGDNSLSQYVSGNLQSIERGILESEEPINVVIYKDNKTFGSNLPELFQLKKRADSSKLDTIYLKRWKEDIDSADPEILEEVIRLTFNKFDTEIKGIEFWSHGLSWIPANNYTESKTRAAQYIGMDGANCTELWDVRQAIEHTKVHLDYLMFDACHMATAEVGYELRNVCDYILASPTEILGDGFPYQQMIHSLSMAKDRSTLLDGLYLTFDDYQESYKSNGTFSLISTAGLDQLYTACLDLQQAASSNLELWATNPGDAQQSIQYYGRKVTNARYYFYDVQDWADHLVQGSEHTTDEVSKALQGCVLRYYHSRSFVAGEVLYINSCCGLAMSIPQFWPLSENDKLDLAYRHIQWQL